MNRKLAVVALAFMLLICTALILEGLYFSSRQCRIGAYYYMWWGLPPPYIDHWKETIKSTPRLGYYNSSDPLIADSHIQSAIKHNIDFFAISWLGEGTWIDWKNWDFSYIDKQNLQNAFLKAPHLSNFSFCLLYETEIVLKTAYQRPGVPANFTQIFLNDMIYAAENYFSNPSYLRVNGRPVMFIYNLPLLYNNLTTANAESLINSTRQELLNVGVNVYLVGDVANQYYSPYFYSMDAVTSYLFLDPAKGWSQMLTDAENYYPFWRSEMNSNGTKFIPGAYPGFNDTGLAAVTKPTVLTPNATAFGQLLNTSIKNADDDSKIVMITSWNEWLEATMIEPSKEKGEDFLDVIPPVASTPIWPLIGTAALGAIIAAGIVTFYFLKRKRHKTTP